jgi:hypothetical protein
MDSTAPAENNRRMANLAGEPVAGCWQKLGLVFRPTRDTSWVISHATAPVPVILKNSACRVFFSGRDDANRSQIGWFDIDLDDPGRGITTEDTPLAGPGPLGGFDGYGLYASSAVRLGETLRLYTIGWNPGSERPLFYSAIGLLETRDMGRTAAWRSSVPILDRDIHDPYSVTGPWVLLEAGVWRMWYVSAVRWERTENGPKSFYNVRYAESDDGLIWRREGIVAVDFASPDETNIGRPCVLRSASGYEAWFGYSRKHGYRIGYGRSRDGKSFDRNVSNPPVLEPSTAFFENETVCHPAVIAYRGHRFMFYNGNQFGRDGIALAIGKAS